MAKVRMTDYSEWDLSVRSNWTWWREKDGIQSATVATEHGLVSAEIYNKDNLTRLEFAMNDRLYHRSWQRAWARGTAAGQRVCPARGKR